jgi:acyl-lipid omega-6 desaturase (Delta-12 desaturase)
VNDEAATERRKIRLFYSRRRLFWPLVCFSLVFAGYGVTTWIILVSPPLVSLVLVPLDGLLVTMLFVIGHDACHQSFTSSNALNRVIGRVAFLPALHAYSLWDRDHNQRHHRYNNVKSMDYAWVPLSPTEFSALGPIRRFKYRFFRTPGGVLFYYMIELWVRRNLLPRARNLGNVRRKHIADCLLVWAFFVGYSAFLAAIGQYSSHSAIEAVALAFLLPFFVFSALISAATFLQHTHYFTPWYATVADWRQSNGAAHGPVHVQFPWVFRKIFLHIMEHNGHHFIPGVPLYNLPGLQELMLQSGVVRWRFTLPEYIQVCFRCKLFDYETTCWVDYRGRVTSEIPDPNGRPPRRAALNPGPPKAAAQKIRMRHSGAISGGTPAAPSAARDNPPR